MDKVRAALGDRKEVDDRRMARMQLLVWRADDEQENFQKFTAATYGGRILPGPIDLWTRNRVR